MSHVRRFDEQLERFNHEICILSDVHVPYIDDSLFSSWLFPSVLPHRFLSPFIFTVSPHVSPSPPEWIDETPLVKDKYKRETDQVNSSLKIYPA